MARFLIFVKKLLNFKIVAFADAGSFPVRRPVVPSREGRLSPRDALRPFGSPSIS